VAGEAAEHAAEPVPVALERVVVEPQELGALGHELLAVRRVRLAQVLERVTGVDDQHVHEERRTEQDERRDADAPEDELEHGLPLRGGRSTASAEESDQWVTVGHGMKCATIDPGQIGRASCRERVQRWAVYTQRN